MSSGVYDARLSGIRREIDNAFFELIHERWRPPAESQWEPPADIFENDEAYFVTVDLPGVLPGSVRCAVEEHRVILSGSRTTTMSLPVERHVMKERTAGCFSRTLYLYNAVDPHKADISWEHGVLRAVLPKRSKGPAEDEGRATVMEIGEAAYGG